MALDQLVQHYDWIVPLIPALPALGFLVTIILGGLVLHHRTPWVTISCMAVSTLLAWFAVFLPVVREFLSHAGSGHHPAFHWSQDWYWAAAGGIGENLQVGVMVDHLTAAMLAMVTLVVLLIEIYSVGYMHGDRHYSRFHSYVSLFAAGMLGLVVSNNYLTLLISWEIMGVCSYLLIGFWYHKDSARRAAKKAFLVTRLGDCGMLLGIMVAYGYTGSFQFEVIFAWAKTAAPVIVALVGLGLFLGSVGKSAQFPLHVWLPDAMEGPTPVSALIHAATMVSAGVYLMARSYPLLAIPSAAGEEAQFIVGWLAWWGEAAPAWSWRVYQLDPMLTVAWVGGFTALFAATIAIFASDIKKVLAYSTISQLGYMMLAIGLGGYTAACFHLLTHAFFKALLFLGSGSVIHAVEHAMHHEGIHEDPQNMYNMGGLWQKMPATFVTFLLGTLALAGIPPFAGFFSKDEILLEAFHGPHAHSLLAGMAMLAAFLTAFYMTRLMVLTFFGRPRFPKAWEHTEDSTRWMTVPLMALAVFAVAAGWPAAPALWGGPNLFHDFINLYPLKQYGVAVPPALRPDLLLAATATLVATSGIALGYLLYATRPGVLARRLAWRLPLTRWLMTAPKRLYWMDEILGALLVQPMYIAMRGCNAMDRYVIDLTVNLVGWLTMLTSSVWRWFDQNVVDLLVNFCGWFAKATAEVGKFFQSGRVQSYTMLATVSLLVLVVLRLVWLGAV